MQYFINPKLPPKFGSELIQPLKIPRNSSTNSEGLPPTSQAARASTFHAPLLERTWPCWLMWVIVYGGFMGEPCETMCNWVILLYQVSIYQRVWSKASSKEGEQHLHLGRFFGNPRVVTDVFNMFWQNDGNGLVSIHWIQSSPFNHHQQQQIIPYHGSSASAVIMVKLQSPGCTFAQSLMLENQLTIINSQQ